MYRRNVDGDGCAIEIQPQCGADDEGNVHKDIVKSTIAINTWTLAGQDKAIVDLLCQLGKKMNMSINKATITPEELNALIDWFVNLMYEARDRLNFIQL